MAAPPPQERAGMGGLLAVVALIVATRVFGVSALMPVLSPHASAMTTSAWLAGLAFGGYGLTMALLQTPLGALSDRVGRRRVILLGLAVAAAGNLIAYAAPNITWLIVGRLVEGIGAVSSVALALLSDHVPDARRTLSLAVAGIAAGGAFLIGVAVGPLLAAAIGVRAIFLVSAALAAAVMAATVAWVPADGATTAQAPTISATSRVLRDGRLLAIDGAGLVMNTILTATMFALPLRLVDRGRDVAFDDPSYRTMLLVTVLIGGILSIGAARAADRRGAVGATAVVAALAVGAGAAMLLSGSGLAVLYGAAIVYFAGHGALSAALPSRIGALVDRTHRGAAMGLYTSSTFLGSFLGGLVGAAWWHRGDLLAAAAAAAGAVTAVWLWVTQRTRGDH